MTLDINLILILSFLTWHYALACGYISDDHAAVATRKDIIPDEEKKDRGESYWVKVFNDGIVMYYTTRFLWKMGFKDAPFVWHLLTLGLHLANTYLFYVFLSPIFGEQIALYACAFWTVNPMLNQNVVWISGRAYTIAVCLSLVALIYWQNPLIYGVCYLLAVITNISIFFLPIITFLIHPEALQSKIYLGVMLLGAFPFLVWKFQRRFTKGLVIDRENFRFKPRKTNTFVRVMMYYIFHLFVPTRMGWYHQAGFRYNEKWEKFNYLTLIGYAVIGALVFYFKFPGIFFLLGLLPNSNLYATNSFLQDRYIYWCSMGICLILAPYLVQYDWLFYGAIAFYATRAYSYSRHLKNDEKLYRENWRNHERSDYAVNNLSYFLIQQHRYDEARVVIERGLAINKMNKMLWYNLGITFAAQGSFVNDESKFKFIKALDCWKMCMQIEPRWSKPAEDIKKLIKLLVDNKVITFDKGKSAEGVQISVPNLLGLKEIIHGSGEQEAKVVPEETQSTP